MKFDTDYFKKKRGLIALIIMIVALPVLVLVLQKQQETRQHAASSDEVAVYMTSTTDTTPLTTLSIPNNGQVTVRVFLDTRGHTINGFDITGDVGANARIVSGIEGQGATNFPDLVFKEFINGSNLTESPRMIHFAKVNPDPNAQIRGVIHIATMVLSSNETVGSTGVIHVSKATVTSLEKTTGAALLAETTNDVTYTVVAAVTPSVTPTPGQQTFDKSLTVHVFTDPDRSTTQSGANEFNYSHICVSLSGANVRGCQGTDASGNATFNTLPSGSYHVTLGMSSELEVTDLNRINQTTVSVVLPPNQDLTTNIGVAPIQGTTPASPHGNIEVGFFHSTTYTIGSYTPLSFDTGATGVSLRKIEGYRIRTTASNADIADPTKWIAMPAAANDDFGNCNNTVLCGKSFVWSAQQTPTTADIGTWYVFLNVYDYSGKACTGNPLVTQISGLVDCNPAVGQDVLQITVVGSGAGTPTPSLTPTATLTPTITLTPSPIPTNAPNTYSVSGKVFVDTNNNQALDAGETGYTGGDAVMTITSLPGAQTTRTATADSNGNYIFQNIPGGVYPLFLAPPPAGWLNTTSAHSIAVPPSATEDFGIRQAIALSPTPTVPACSGANLSNPHGACVNSACISVSSCGTNDCAASIDCNPTATPTPTCAIAGQTNPHGVCSGSSCVAVASCGANACSIGSSSACVVATTTPVPTSIPTATIAPTTTPVIGGIQIALNLILQAIGPVDNPTPLHPQRTVSVQVFNSTNQMIGDKSGTVAMNTAKHFAGIIDLGVLTPGNYTVKIKSDKYLRRLLPGIQNLVIGLNTMPESTLVVGDVNNDNTLSLLDYNVMRDCYQGINPLPMTNPNSRFNQTACNSHPEKAMTDLDDNGIVNEVDYNYFIRSLATQPGQ